MDNVEHVQKTVVVVTSPGFVQAVDDWRRKQPAIVSRSEAIRTLTLRSIAAEKTNGNGLDQHG